ncbi:nucleotidyl transferase AbiEii/AbiGii toxin family protein [Parafilimonas sp.]|uniref:nucleotidyl transferase AbiEii/AbiGii toxin family protein n=1 Tax=Parafilimonas sp. TaxID=1969739 RepID=UPI0039E39625
MIDLKTLSADWIAEKRKKYSKDPNLMESVIYALYLLEQLQLSGLEFVFKGGTSLILLMKEPKRFSVDIDIIVNPKIGKEELERYLSKIEETSVFTRMKLDERRSYQGDIPKAHYKFFYNSNFANKNQEGQVISNPEREILLDILFAENHYPTLVEIPLETEWLLQNDERIIVTTPDINSILGDKLTAFAPNTTGVPYNVEKEKEILKQLFDIGNLFDLLTDINVLKKSFLETAKGEIAYRPERKIELVEQVLRDTIDTALLIAKKDILKTEGEKVKFAEINTGINQFRHFVFVGKFEILEAQVAAAKAAYLAAIILTDHNNELNKFNETIPLTDYLITNTDYNFLNKRLKFVAKGEALFYWFQTIKLLKNE